jgi:hypothetical protein
VNPYYRCSRSRSKGSFTSLHVNRSMNDDCMAVWVKPQILGSHLKLFLGHSVEQVQFGICRYMMRSNIHIQEWLVIFTRQAKTEYMNILIISPSCGLFSFHRHCA